VEMNLHLAQSHLHHLRDRFDQGRIVLLTREEERVTRAPARGVSKAVREARVTLAPPGDPLETGDQARPVPVERLEMVTEREEQVPCAARGAAQRLRGPVA
jgi:hypothetical protein